MRIIYFLSLSFLFLCFSCVSSASTLYTWDRSLVSGVDHYPSGDEACKAMLGPPVQGQAWYNYAESETRWRCRFSNYGTMEYYGYANRNTGVYCPYGDNGTACNSSCDLPNTMVNGQCATPEPDVCESSAGSDVFHEHRAGNVSGGSGSEPPGSVCEGGCQSAYSFEQPVNCYRKSGVSQDDIFCKFKYKNNGVSCTSSPDPVTGNSVFDQPPTQPPIDTTPVYDNSSNCDSWVTQADGTATRNCTSSETYDNPGSMDCVDGYDSASCKSSTPPPAYTDKQTSQDITKVTNPDGSVTTTTTTTTTTGCYGVKPCTTSETTTTQTTTQGSDGTVTSDETTCTGPNCGKDGTDNDPTKDPEEEEGEEEERLAEAGDCDAGFSCSGDAIDCAVLQKQKEQLCHSKEQSDFDTNRADIEGLFDGEEFELETSEIQIPSFVNSGTRFLPSQCPPPEQVSLTSNGGHTYQFSYDPMCSFATDFSWLIITMMGIWCAVYVGRAFGGE